MKKIYLLIFTLFFIFGFKPAKQLIAEIKTNEQTQIYPDHLDNIYLVNDNNLEKLSSKGKLIFKYSSKIQGNLKFVDTSNPLKLLLFYPELNQITFLDNMLAESSTQINLFEMGYYQVTLACNSYNNSFWIYDQTKFELVRLNMNGQQLYKSNNLNQIINNANPNYLLEYDNKVYLNIPEAGIFVFDIYGSYLNKIDITNLNKFQIKDNKIYFVQDNLLQFYDFGTKLINQIQLADTQFVDINISPNLLLVSFTNGTKIYSTK